MEGPVLDISPADELVLYRSVKHDPVVRHLDDHGEYREGELDGFLRLLEFAERYGITGNLQQAYFTVAILEDENPWSLACECRGDPGGSLGLIAQGDMRILLDLFREGATPPPLGRRPSYAVHDLRSSALELFHYDRGDQTPTAAGQLICCWRDRFAAAKDAAELRGLVAEAYRTLGAGAFALCRAFRAERDGGLSPIPGAQTAPLDALVGYELQKKALRENTEAFLAGRESNHVLLYGDAGTGKSTCVRALLTEYADSPLRLIELRRSCFEALPKLLSTLRGRGERFILFIDDLSFEEHETEYKHLKAAIEGGLETMPENVRIYATSNRRHLIRETWSDRNDVEHDGDLHHSDTVEEKLSLAGRFGVTIRFDSPDRRLYHAIVEALAEEARVELEREILLRKADAWEIRHGGPTGRTARQFIDALAGAQA